MTEVTVTSSEPLLLLLRLWKSVELAWIFVEIYGHTYGHSVEICGDCVEIHGNDMRMMCGNDADDILGHVRANL